VEKRIRRQHTVSRFYLRGFADGREQVRRIQLPGDNVLTMSISDASVIKDFYSVELPDGTLSDMFERAFSDVEGVASAALGEVQRGVWPLPLEHKEALAAWIALQHLRGEEPRASQTQIGGELIRLVVGTSGKEALRRHIEAAEGRQVPDDELDAEWADLTKEGGPNLQHDVLQHMRTVMDVWPGMTSYLVDSHWTLIRFERRGLVTSDHPVTMAVDRTEQNFYGVGIATADLFSVPLSRRLALNIQPRRRLEDYTKNTDEVPDFEVSGTTQFANSMNQQTVSQARRYLYLHPEDVLDERIHVPPPVTRSHMTMSNVDHMIREEGLYADVPPANRVPGIPGSGEGVSLRDIPWPIPGRQPLNLK